MGFPNISEDDQVIGEQRGMALFEEVSSKSAEYAGPLALYNALQTYCEMSKTDSVAVSLFVLLTIQGLAAGLEKAFGENWREQVTAAISAPAPTAGRLH